FGLPFNRWLPRLINSSHLIQLRASIHPELDENLGQRPEGDDGRRKSSTLPRRWLRPPQAAMASLRGCAKTEFRSHAIKAYVHCEGKRVGYASTTTAYTQDACE